MLSVSSVRVNSLNRRFKGSEKLWLEGLAPASRCLPKRRAVAADRLLFVANVQRTDGREWRRCLRRSKILPRLCPRFA